MSSLLSASPGSRLLLQARLQPPLCAARPLGSGDRVPALGNTACLLHREAAERPDGALTDRQSTGHFNAQVSLRASPDAQRPLDCLSVHEQSHSGVLC